MNGCGAADVATGTVSRSASIVHEIGHALGLKHEHQRSDASSFVDYDSSCVLGSVSKAADFNTDGAYFGPYNIDSIMHYGSYNAAKRSQPDFAPDLVYFDAGYLVLELDSAFAAGSPAWQDIFGATGTPDAKQLLFDAVYSGPIDGINSTLRFTGPSSPGKGLLVGPYGASTYAVRIEASYVSGTTPLSTTADRTNVANWELRADYLQERPDCPVLTRAGTTWADADHLLAFQEQLHTKGDLSSLYDLYPGSTGTLSAGQRLGTALAQGDFDGDGLIYLAVADPDGSVAIYRGAHDGNDTGETQFVPMEVIVLDDAEALAAGDFNGDGYDDLAVGSPEHDGSRGGVLVILGSDEGLDFGGSPVDVESEPSQNVPMGSGDVPVIWKLSAAQSLELTFGSGTWYADPTITTATPGAYVLTAGTDWTHDVLADFPTLQCYKQNALANLFIPGARVGHSLVAADLDNDGLDDLLIGAPGADAFLEASDPAAFPSPSTVKVDLLGHDGTTGAVAVLRGVPTNDVTVAPLEPVDVLTPYTPAIPDLRQLLYGGSHRDSEFGTALATHDLDGDGCLDVLVGAPADYPELGTTGTTDGDPLGPGPYVHAGRAFAFINGLQDGACLSAHPSADVYDPSNFQCRYRFRARLAWSEPNAEDGAEYGYAVEGAVINGNLRILVGAPGTDLPGQPPDPDAGKVWLHIMSPSLSVQGLTQNSSGSVRGSPARADERFGSALDWHSDLGLLVGTPGDAGGEGSVDWFEGSGGLLQPSTVPGGLPGVRASDLPGLATPAGPRLGTSVQWSYWEVDPEYAPSGYGPGILAGAPHAHVNMGVDAGVVMALRGNSTWSGLAWSFADMQVHSR